MMRVARPLSSVDDRASVWCFFFSGGVIGVEEESVGQEETVGRSVGQAQAQRFPKSRSVL